jgi:hypothetical protein
VDAATGALDSWNPNPSTGQYNGVFALAANGSRIYAGGGFNSIGGLPNAYVAEISDGVTGVPLPGPSSTESLSLSIWPNPAHDGGLIGFSLARAAEVTLRVVDVSGREVARLAEREPFEAGPHEIHFDARGLPSGIYVYWLRAGGESIARRMVLIP